MVLARRRHRQRPGLQPRAHHRPKVVHRQKGPRLRHHPGRFDRRPRCAVPGARLAAHPESGHLWRPQGTRRHLLCDDRRLRPVPEGPRGRLAARGLRGPQGRRARRYLRRPHPGRDGQDPALLGPHRHLRLCRHRGYPARGQGCLHRRRPALRRPHERRGCRPRRRGRLRQHLRQPGRSPFLWSDHRQARRLQVAAHQPCRHHRRTRHHVDELYAEHVLCGARPARL